MMQLSRRQMLGMFGGLAAMGGIGLAGCSDGEAKGGPQAIRLAWWGNSLRNAQTKKATELFLKENSDITIGSEPAEFAAYWDKLATQTAANDSPDMIQMADGFMAEYGGRGALLDLKDLVDVSKFSAGTVESGTIDGKLVGINAGINAPSIFCNTAVLKRAGVEVPDDKTWTWDDYRDVASQVAKDSPDGTVGTESPFAEGVLRAWLRQHGDELFTTEGALGATADNVRSYFEMLLDFGNAKAIPRPEAVVESSGKSLEESSLATGKAAFALIWSNQFSAMSEVADDEIIMLRMPTVTGRPEDLKAWYHPSMLWSASSRTKNPELVGKVIDWWVNSEDCAAICLDERGFPANTEIVSAIQPKLSPEGQRVAEFLADLEPVLGDPQPIPPPGASTVLGDLLTRVHTDLMFDKIDTVKATDQFITEAKGALAN